MLHMKIKIEMYTLYAHVHMHNPVVHTYKLNTIAATKDHYLISFTGQKRGAFFIYSDEQHQFKKILMWTGNYKLVYRISLHYKLSAMTWEK